MSRRKYNLNLLFWLLFFLTACAAQQDSAIEQNREVVIGEQTISVIVAETPLAQSKGLGGVTEFSWEEGMLFPFQDKDIRTFWMKDMLMSIDILWIDGQRIVGIEKSVPYPDPKDLLADLPRYTSPEPVDHVLEVKAGFTDKFDIEVGDMVTYR